MIRPALLWWAGGTFAFDQATKALVLYGLNLLERGRIEVLPPYLVFQMAWNEGINFGLLSGGDVTRWLLVVLAVAVSGWVLWWLRADERPLALAAGGLLVGGALGNVLDRLVHGAVADFLNMSCCGIENPYVFNVADIAIFVGAVGLALLPSRAAGRDGAKRR